MRTFGFGRFSQSRPTAIRQLVPLGWVNTMVQVPSWEAKTSMMPPLAVRPMEPGASVSDFFRLSEMLWWDPQTGCARATGAERTKPMVRIRVLK